MNNAMLAFFICAASFCAFANVRAQDEASKTPPALDVTITYTDPDSSEELEVSGKLKFEKLPLLLDGKPIGISLRELVSFRHRDAAMTCWIRRDAETGGGKPVFMVCAMSAIMLAGFNFDRIGVEVEKKGMVQKRLFLGNRRQYRIDAREAQDFFNSDGGLKRCSSGVLEHLEAQQFHPVRMRVA